MWILVLIAININNAQDRPAWIELPFESEQACEVARDQIRYWIKFQNFRLEASCQPSLS